MRVHAIHSYSFELAHFRKRMYAKQLWVCCILGEWNAPQDEYVQTSYDHISAQPEKSVHRTLERCIVVGHTILA